MELGTGFKIVALVFFVLFTTSQILLCASAVKSFREGDGSVHPVPQPVPSPFR